MTEHDELPQNHGSFTETEAAPPIEESCVKDAAQDTDQEDGSEPTAKESERPGGETRPSFSNRQYHIPDEYANLNELTGPLPVENPHEEGVYRHHDLEEARSSVQEEIQDTQSVSLQLNDEGEDDLHEYANLDELEVPPPDENPDERRTYRHHDLEEARASDQQYERRDSCQEPKRRPSAHDENRSPQKTRERKIHRMIFHLYVTSYLILFSVLGTLARVGLQALTIYPGSPIAISGLWANVGGCLIMGFLSEDRALFNNEWEIAMKRARQDLQLERENSEDMTQEAAHEEAILAAARKQHQTKKKTIPGFIGLSVGFCGCFTSFSSFMRDVFFALSNRLDTDAYTDNRTVIGTGNPRNDGNSVMAVLAVLILEICLCLSAQDFGAHIAIALEPVMLKAPRLNMRKITDPVVVLIAWYVFSEFMFSLEPNVESRDMSREHLHSLVRPVLKLATPPQTSKTDSEMIIRGSWAGAVVMVIWPPDHPSGPAADGRTTWAQETWRANVLIALVLAPLGCLFRFHAALKFNGLINYFPMGTFIVNIAGTVVLGACWDLQRAPLTNGAIGEGRIGCQVLQGVQDGFCGCLTTVSTWIIELKGLQRKHAYFYGGISVAVGLSSLVAVMGTFVWEQENWATACSV